MTSLSEIVVPTLTISTKSPKSTSGNTKNHCQGRIQLTKSGLNTRCGAKQTQTVTRQSSTITIALIQGKEKLPDLDDGGTRFPPRNDGGGGGGGGGWIGGFFFFGFLAFLGFLKDQESEGPYRDNKRS